MDFIEFRLLWEGRINRSDLTDFFGVSMPQASADLANYAALAPSNLAYDASEKVYKAATAFKPIRTDGTAQQYFVHLLGQAKGRSQSTSFIGWVPPFEVVEATPRFIDPDTLIAVLSAIRHRVALEIEYQSLTRPEPTRRWITPTVLVNDEFRWHARAWCHTRNRYADFVLGRIASTFGTRPNEVSLPEDTDWLTFITLRIRPNPELSQAQRRSAEMDYEMQNGRLEVQCRKALVFYLLRRLRLDEVGNTLPKARQLVLDNREEVFAAAGETSDFSLKVGKETGDEKQGLR